MENTQSSALRTAVEKTNPEILRRVLMEICESNPETRKLLEARLLVNVKPVEPAQEASRKRKLTNISQTGEGSEQRFQTCVQCKETYDITENGEDSCQWHEGEKEVGQDELSQAFWNSFDWEPWRDGSPADFADDPSFAEGFTWTCCDGEGDDEGCKVTRHRHVGEKNSEPEPKQQKIEAPPADIITISDSEEEDDAETDSHGENDDQEENEDDEEEYPNDEENIWDCGHCGKTYNERNNWREDCYFHDGNLEEPDDPDIDPDVMIWNCCDKERESQGCRTMNHAPSRGMGYCNPYF